MKLPRRPVKSIYRFFRRRGLDKYGKKIFAELSHQEKELFYRLSTEQVKKFNFLGEVIDSNSHSNVIKMFRAQKPAFGDSMTTFNRLAATAKRERDAAWSKIRQMLSGREITKEEVRQSKIMTTGEFAQKYREAIKREFKQQQYKPRDIDSPEELKKAKAKMLADLGKGQSKSRGMSR